MRKRTVALNFVSLTLLLVVPAVSAGEIQEQSLLETVLDFLANLFDAGESGAETADDEGGGLVIPIGYEDLPSSNCAQVPGGAAGYAAGPRGR